MKDPGKYGWRTGRGGQMTVRRVVGKNEERRVKGIERIMDGGKMNWGKKE